MITGLGIVVGLLTEVRVTISVEGGPSTEGINTKLNRVSNRFQ